MICGDISTVYGNILIFMFGFQRWLDFFYFSGVSDRVYVSDECISDEYIGDEYVSDEYVSVEA